MGLQEDAVDLFEIYGCSVRKAERLITDGHHHRCETEVSDASEDAFAGACDEGEGLVGECVVTESDLVVDFQTDITRRGRIRALLSRVFGGVSLGEFGAFL